MSKFDYRMKRDYLIDRVFYSLADGLGMFALVSTVCACILLGAYTVKGVLWLVLH